MTLSYSLVDLLGCQKRSSNQHPAILSDFWPPDCKVQPQARRFWDVFPHLHLSASPSPTLHCALKELSWQALLISWHMAVPFEVASHSQDQQAFVGSRDFSDSAPNFVRMWSLPEDAQESFHLSGLYSLFYLSCQGPWFTCIQKRWCHQGPYQSDLWAECKGRVVSSYRKMRLHTCKSQPNSHFPWC